MSAVAKNDVAFETPYGNVNGRMGSDLYSDSDGASSYISMLSYTFQVQSLGACSISRIG